MQPSWHKDLKLIQKINKTIVVNLGSITKSDNGKDDQEPSAGMVQAWVAQTTLKRIIFRIFTMSDLINM